jgi:putative tryptophan/tyrosine transport system substrate-binding protein
MRRREFFGVLGGAAAAWPVAVRAQQGESVRRIGIILPAASDDAEFQTRLAAFHQALEQLGWIIGRNVRIDTRWATTNAADIRRHVEELVALTPDVILANGTSTLGPLLQVSRTIRSCSSRSLIRSAAAMSKAWRNREAMPLASRQANTA